MECDFAAAIREAIALGEFTRAQRQWEEYAAAIEIEIEAGRFSPAELRELGRLVEWSRVALLCASARMQDDLGALHVASEYEASCGAAGPRMILARY